MEYVQKKLSFRRNVVSLAAELKDVRNKLASKEQLFVRESQTRKVAETKARSMEEEVSKLQKCLQEKDEQLRSSTSSTEQYLHELDDLRTQLSFTRATAEASAASAKSAQLDLLQKDLQARELSQMQLKDEVIRIETDIMDAVAKAGSKSDEDKELLKILSDVSPRNDTEIARLREEIRILSAHWTNKTKELESQLEKHRRTDQELKKRVLKLEFCLQESQSQMRKLKRMGENRDKTLKELMDQVAMKPQQLVPRHQGEFLGEPGLQVHRLHVDASPGDPCKTMKTAGILNSIMCKEVKIPALGEQLAHSL
ncbi:hypothetical protein C2845_PM05G11720 [Panicum miliaceum]|uniref:Uncharacterized protein n=1 Tax=Panicum miliaceum TaxID=4540 RepID=A0A3L6T065_PANMI|nr:hypothetical protein C2845_PM05G11720 [Panicum miliaceum]